MSSYITNKGFIVDELKLISGRDSYSFEAYTFSIKNLDENIDYQIPILYWNILGQASNHPFGDISITDLFKLNVPEILNKCLLLKQALMLDSNQTEVKKELKSELSTFQNRLLYENFLSTEVDYKIEDRINDLSDELMTKLYKD